MSKIMFAMSDLQRAYYNSYNSDETPAYIIKKISVKDLDIERLVYTEREIIKKYDILRCKMFSDGTQEIFPVDNELVPYIDITDLSDMEENIREEELKKIENKIHIQTGDPEKLDLFKTFVVKISESQWYIYFRMDGMITDGSASEILITELDRIYTGEDEITLSNNSYMDYCKVCEQVKMTEEYNTSMKFWKEKVKLFTEPPVLPIKQDYQKHSHKEPLESQFELSYTTDEKINLLAERLNISKTSLRLTAFCKTLEIYSETSDFLINIPYDKRFDDQFKNLFGECADYFIYNYARAENESFIQTACRIDREIKEMQSHSAFTGNDILTEYIRYHNKFDGVGIPVVFTDLADNKYRHTYSFKDIGMFSHTAEVWLDMVFYRCNEKTCVNIDSSENIFKNNFIENFISSYQRTIDNIDQWENLHTAFLPYGEEEFLEEFNNTCVEREYKPYAEIIENNYHEYYDRPAVCTEKRIFTYREFFEDVKGICKYFGDKSILDQRVGIILGKGYNITLWALGTVLSGNIYVPLDYDYPETTMKQCLDILNIKTIVTNNEFLNKIKDHGKYQIINIDEIKIQPEKNYEFVMREPQNAFAVIHTSGSTGVPKAVELTHAGILNTLIFSKEKMNLKCDDRILALTNHCHDMSLFDMFGMFICGASVVVIDHYHWQDPFVWADLITKYNIRLWNSVPSIMEAFISVLDDKAISSLQSMRMIIHGGEAIPIYEIKKLMEGLPKCRFLSVGGPTETSIWSIYHYISLEDTQKDIIPYGKPIDNIKYRLLNACGHDVPYGVRGSMYVSGTGVIHSYADGCNPEKFINDADGNIWYNTGDMGIYTDEKNIVFSGRIDNQIKRFGKRIELDGIERIAVLHCRVDNAKVFLNPENSDLILCYTSAEEYEDDFMRKTFTEYVPEYMIPQYFIRVGKMPLTHNGKINKNELLKISEAYINNNRADTDDELAGDAKYIEFSNIVKECLGTSSEIKSCDNFFMIGGNSLTAMKLSAKIRKKYNVKISMKNIFVYPTIEQIYRYIKDVLDKEYASQNNATDIPENQEIFPLTKLQKIMFLAQLMNIKTDKIILTGYADYDFIPNLKAFRKACMITWEKHEALKYSFDIGSDGEPYQKINRQPGNYKEIISIKESSDFEIDTKECATWIPDLYKGDNGRAILLVDNENKKSRLVITIHHIVSDEYSFTILFRDVEKIYNSIINENRLPNSEKGGSYGRYVIEKGKRIKNIKEYDLKFKNLPDIVTMPGADKNSDKGETLFFNIEREISEKFNESCKINGITSFTGMLTAVVISFACVVKNKYNGFIIPVSDRFEYDAQDTIGNYIEEYLYMINIEPNMTFKDAVEEVNKLYKNMIISGTDSFIKYIDKMGMEDEFNRKRMLYPYFNYFESSSESMSSNFRFYESADTSETNIIYMVTNTNNVYNLMLGYKNSFCSKLETELLVESFLKAIKYIAVNSDSKISDFMDELQYKEFSDERDEDLFLNTSETGIDNQSENTDKEYTELIRAAWEEVLNKPCEDGNINFFDAGGYSFLLYKLSVAVNKKTGLKVPFVSLMTYPTINTLAEYLNDFEDEE